jgi:hypothetical protein
MFAYISCVVMLK